MVWRQVKHSKVARDPFISIGAFVTQKSKVRCEWGLSGGESTFAITTCKGRFKLAVHLLFS